MAIGVNRKFTQSNDWPLSSQREIEWCMKSGKTNQFTFTFCSRHQWKSRNSPKSKLCAPQLKHPAVLELSIVSIVHLPAGTPGGGRKSSGCPCRPTAPWWRAGSAGRPRPPAARWPSGPSGCQRPSGCRRTAGWPGRPMGCAASRGRQPARGRLARGSEKMAVKEVSQCWLHSRANDSEAEAKQNVENDECRKKLECTRKRCIGSKYQWLSHHKLLLGWHLDGWNVSLLASVKWPHVTWQATLNQRVHKENQHNYSPKLLIYNIELNSLKSVFFHLWILFT